MYKHPLLYVCLFILVLTGCQPRPEVSASVHTVPISTQKIDATLGQVNVQLAPDHLRQGYLSPETQALTPVWQNGITDALIQSQVFTPGSPNKVNILVNIIRLDNKQNENMDVTTTAVASYEVYDAKTQQLLWVRGISTSNTVSYQEAPVQGTRDRISLNRAIQSNISKFIELYGQGAINHAPVPESELRIRQ